MEDPGPQDPHWGSSIWAAPGALMRKQVLGQESAFFLDPQVDIVDTNVWDPALTSSIRMATHHWGHPLGDMVPEGDIVIFPRTTLSLC